jgi:hypothetical protein
MRTRWYGFQSSTPQIMFLEMKTLKWQHGDNIDTHNNTWKWYDIDNGKQANLVDLN